MDTLSKQQRSEHMARIRGKDTGPEWVVRRMVHGAGYRYRLHDKRLPGQPDLVFPGRRKVIFVHGCFWHQHAGCRLCRLPRSRPEYWHPKLTRNVERDKEVVQALKDLGWQVGIIWECEVKDRAALEGWLATFLIER